MSTVAIVKILAIWTAISVTFGLLIAPALARRLRRSCGRSGKVLHMKTPVAVKARVFPRMPRLARCPILSSSDRSRAAISEKWRRRGH